MRPLYFTIFICFLLSFQGLSQTNANRNCEENCETEILVLDRDGNPMDGVAITVKLCCNDSGEYGKEIKKKTGKDGIARFNYCPGDMCDRMINGVSIIPEECNALDEDRKKWRCVLKYD